tara:strand:+ start:195 stop:488 length:294 start_codon:yes stop_codon:yes gene_type:complete
MKKLTLSVAALTIATMSYSQTQCKSDSVQCKRIDIYKQCENVTKAKNGLCYLHNPFYKDRVKIPAKICSGTTKKGNNCKNKTKHESGLCHFHQPKEN